MPLRLPLGGVATLSPSFFSLVLSRMLGEGWSGVNVPGLLALRFLSPPVGLVLSLASVIEEVEEEEGAGVAPVEPPIRSTLARLRLEEPPHISKG